MHPVLKGKSYTKWPHLCVSVCIDERERERERERVNDQWLWIKVNVQSLSYCTLKVCSCFR